MRSWKGGGVEPGCAVDFEKVASLLDEETAQYSCGEYVYKIRSGKGTLGQHWDLVIDAMDPNMEGQPLFPLGRIEIEPEGDGMVNLRVPPRIQQTVHGEDAADWDGKLFGSYVSRSDFRPDRMAYSQKAWLGIISVVD